MQDKLKLDTKELYKIRLVVLLEEEPQSNKYRQVMLNPGEFKKVSDVVHSIGEKEENHNCGNPDCDGLQLVLSDRIITLPDIQDIHRCTDNCDC